MTSDDPRAILETLIRERGEDYASLSRMLGRNAAYIQQFIKRGVPKKLDEEDRLTLARYFNVSEASLGGRAIEPIASVALGAGPRSAQELVAVPFFDVGASAGPGAVGSDDQAPARFAFRAGWLREMAGGGPEHLSIIRVSGDSMIPTLADGDDILVDAADGADRLRDGIYVLRNEGMLNVKRIAMRPSGREFEVRSDNPAYPSWTRVSLDAIEVVGRVIWAGRQIK